MKPELRKKIEAAKLAKASATPKKLYKVVDTNGTKYLPDPLVIDEIVEWIEDHKTEEQFIKVRHGKNKDAISIFHRSHFKRHIDKVKK